MPDDQPRGPRWLTGAGSVMRWTTRPALAAARRQPDTLPYLRRSHERPAGLGWADGQPSLRLPLGFAVLRVQRTHTPDGSDGYRLHGWCGDLTVTCAPGSTRLTAPAVSLAKLRQESGEYPSEVLRGIRLWSQNQSALAHWINRIRARHGSALRLIVWDDTGYELPWELFWLPDERETDLPGGLLGALVVTTRWTTVHDANHDLPRHYGECRGRVLGYLHTDMADDGMAFTPYVHRMHRKMTPFLEALDRAADRTGLVYMGCHGSYGDTVTRLLLGGRTWAEFNGESMHTLRRDSALVCLNACHSGRFVDNRSQGEQALRGFAELFLRKGAGGCIVTAGKVGDSEARTLVRRLVCEVAAQPQRSVSENLRDFRAHAAKEFGSLTLIPSVRDDEGRIDAAGQKRVLRLLYAFMFHYYGHPSTTLRLAARSGGDDTEGANAR